ncbi:MAG: NAD(P)H-hydrate dehydratase [Betaproteobacteria bacterium]|nr:NAD(P)H-hydrate dehydratase [Betaproteobacteria bacterium]
MKNALYQVAALRALEADHASQPLMQRAGEAIAKRARAKVKPDQKILVLAGPGNNGGDAWVAAEILRKAHYPVTVLAPVANASREAAAQRAISAYVKAGGEVVMRAAQIGKHTYPLIIDGLFGIGLKRPPDGEFAAIIHAVNAKHGKSHILAIDIPSGLDADTGHAFQPAILADETLTFIGLKPGLYTGDGVDLAGAIRLEPLGLKPADSGNHLLDTDCIAPPPRRNNTHKGSYGSVGVIGGAAGMIGAALLAARAALHMGPGKVLLGLMAEDAIPVDPLHPEIILRRAHTLCQDIHVDAYAVGMGMGAVKPALLKGLLAKTTPLVIDADALNAIAASTSLQKALQQSRAVRILTPHPGEAARLLQTTTDAVQSDRIRAAQALARQYQAITILKGAGTVIAQPDGHYHLNTTGNPGMASGGMGDALAGMLAAFLAQGMTALEAAQLAVTLHGAAADACLEHGMAPRGLTASEVIFEARSLLNGGHV